MKLVDGLKVNSQNALVEFAPGMGYTVSFLLQKKPKTYIGIELNEEAASKLTQKNTNEYYRIVNTSAANPELEDSSTHREIQGSMLPCGSDT